MEGIPRDSERLRQLHREHAARRRRPARRRRQPRPLPDRPRVALDHRPVHQRRRRPLAAARPAVHRVLRGPGRRRPPRRPARVVIPRPLAEARMARRYSSAPMPVDPQCRFLLDQMAASDTKMTELDPPAARKVGDAGLAMVAELAPPVDLASVTDTAFPGPVGDVPRPGVSPPWRRSVAGHRVLPRRRVRHRHHRHPRPHLSAARRRGGRGGGVGRVPPGPRASLPGWCRRLHRRHRLGGRQRGVARHRRRPAWWCAATAPAATSRPSSPNTPAITVRAWRSRH